MRPQVLPDLQRKGHSAAKKSASWRIDLTFWLLLGQAKIAIAIIHTYKKRTIGE